MKFHLVFLQIREAKESRDALARQRREALEDKLQRADMLRESHLQERVRRAQEEEAKARGSLVHCVCGRGYRAKIYFIHAVGERDLLYQHTRGTEQETRSPRKIPGQNCVVKIKQTNKQTTKQNQINKTNF